MSDIPPDVAYRQAQAVEYGTHVANKPIFIDGARAFNEGDPVPVSHVDRGIVLAEDVAKVAEVLADEAPAPVTATEPKPATKPKEG